MTRPPTNSGRAEVPCAPAPESLFTAFAPPPQPEELPATLRSPFDVGEPHPLARRAAEAVMEELGRGLIAPGFPTSLLSGPYGGKMFGVLVVRLGDDRVGYLKAFSAQLQRAWDVPGYVPPVFDREARGRAEPEGEAVVKALTARVDAARAAPELAEVEAQLVTLLARQASEELALQGHHRARRSERHAERARAAGEALRHLDRQSQADEAEQRHARARWREERAALEARRARLLRRLKAVERLRRLVSQEVSWQLYDTYVFHSFSGRRASLRELFGAQVPSSGTGDCAAPKLLTFALRHGLTPLALAEFWWGAPPPGGGRQQGAFFPACRDKCGGVLPFVLEGLEVLPPRRHRPPELKDPLPVLLADARFVVIEKPAGMLSVPGTDASVTDSVLARMRRAYPAAKGPLLVHRLDAETSGLLLVALDAEAHAALQRQFLKREVEKRYVAWLEGEVAQEGGVIELPVRVDLEQRPRQLVDLVHGKKAVTRFTVLSRAQGRTRVAFFPVTGRTHQLRVHAAHPRGLGVPIVGDVLYGRADARLMLHAEALRFRHPGTGAVVEVTAPAPF